MKRRVRRPKDKEDLFEKLANPNKSDHAIFETYKDFMLFAAALGAFKSERTPFEKTLEPIDYSVFANKNDDVLILMLGICENQKLDILAKENSDELITIFEEYANTGLELIDRKIKRSGAEPVTILINLIQEAEKVEDLEEERDFSTIMASLEN